MVPDDFLRRALVAKAHAARLVGTRARPRDGASLILQWTDDQGLSPAPPSCLRRPGQMAPMIRLLALDVFGTFRAAVA